ncbi:MAG: trigger factor [Armatimonadota bacterium]|nr:MAG: trigger factor [Armatimonadota bacterium]
MSRQTQAAGRLEQNFTMELVSQEPVDDGQIRLVIKAGPDKVNEQVEDIYRRLAQTVTIPGFRKGRAPRALLEQQLSPDEARREAAERLAGPMIAWALEQTGLDPFTPPAIEKSELEDDGSATCVASFAPTPKVELGEHRGLTGERSAIEVTEEQIQAQLDRTRERYASYEPVADRAADAGDLALVDYDLVIDGQVIEGQSTHGYPCQIGSDTLFPELNEKLPGLKPGEQVRIPAGFPADHEDASVAGKQGEYVVTLRELKVRTLPELTDEMAQRAHGIESADELRQAVREALERMAAEEVEDRVRQSLLEQVVAASKVTVPPVLVRREAEARLNRLETDLRAEGRSLEEHLREEGVDTERWLRREEMSARWALERSFVLDEIGRREGIEVTQEEISREIENIARRVGSTTERARKAMEERGMSRLVDRLHQHKVLQFLVDHADITSEGGATPGPTELQAPATDEGEAGPAPGELSAGVQGDIADQGEAALEPAEPQEEQP